MTVVHTKISKISFSNDSIVILTQFVIHENQRTAYEIEIRKRIEVNPAREYEIWSMNEQQIMGLVSSTELQTEYVV